MSDSVKLDSLLCDIKNGTTHSAKYWCLKIDLDDIDYIIENLKDVSFYIDKIHSSGGTESYFVNHMSRLEFDARDRNIEIIHINTKKDKE